MPKDVALSFVKANFNPGASHTYDPCVIGDTGVSMDGEFFPYDKLKLVIQIIPLHERYDVKLFNDAALFPDICSYYFGEAGSTSDPANVEKVDRVATAFKSLGVGYDGGT